MIEFQEKYASLYSNMHSDRNYMNLAEALRQYFPNKSMEWKFLDFGSGPGELVSKLCEIGVDAYAYDISESMYRLAKDRLGERALLIGELVPESFTVIASLFDVVSYQETATDLEEYVRQLVTLSSVDGIILVDGWNKLGVTLSPPNYSVRDFTTLDGNFTRRVTPLPVETVGLTSLDIQISKGRTLVSRETHTLRAYEISDLEPHFAKGGFMLADLRCGSNWEDPFKDSCWRFFSAWRKSPS